jgi:predicted Zn-dependent protease
MYSEDLDKIQLLITTKRFDLAQSQLQQLLTQNADDAYLYYLLSSVKYELNLYNEANELINSAISLEPDWAFFYYFKACINLASENYIEVENLLQIAISLKKITKLL